MTAFQKALETVGIIFGEQREGETTGRVGFSRGVKTGSGYELACEELLAEL